MGLHEAHLHCGLKWAVCIGPADKWVGKSGGKLDGRQVLKCSEKKQSRRLLLRYKFHICYLDIRDGNSGNNRLNYDSAKHYYINTYISTYLTAKHTEVCLRSKETVYLANLIDRSEYVIGSLSDWLTIWLTHYLIGYLIKQIHTMRVRKVKIHHL
jgi:hypothetical protein